MLTNVYGSFSAFSNSSATGILYKHSLMFELTLNQVFDCSWNSEMEITRAQHQMRVRVKYYFFFIIDKMLLPLLN